MKKITLFTLTLFILGTVSLTGCHNGKVLNIFSVNQKLTTHEQCLAWRRQMLYNASNRNIEAKYTTHSQKQRIATLYRVHHCHDILDKPNSKLAKTTVSSTKND